MEGTFKLHRPNQSHREFGYRACKQDTDQWCWRKYFCQMEGNISVRPSRSNPIRIGKGSHSQGADNWSMREGRLGSMFFPLSAGKVTLLHETGFLHIKGINFRIRNCTREGIRKKFKILEKNSIEALVIIIWRRKELSNLDNLKGFSMYLGGNCRWVPLSTIA